jgi:hypothetical protein
MNPLLTEVSTTNITSPLHSFFRSLNRNCSRVPSHPEALQERHLTLPRRIDDPGGAARTARALLLNRKEDVNACPLHGRPSPLRRARRRRRRLGLGIPPLGPPGGPGGHGQPGNGLRPCPIYGLYRALNATEGEDASFRAIADAAARHGLAALDHLVVVP